MKIDHKFDKIEKERNRAVRVETHKCLKNNRNMKKALLNKIAGKAFEGKFNLK